MTSKVGAPKGSKNAMRAETPASDWLRQRARAEDKARWQKAAEKQGYKHFSKWVTDVLNAQAKSVLD